MGVLGESEFSGKVQTATLLVYARKVGSDGLHEDFNVGLLPARTERHSRKLLPLLSTPVVVAYGFQGRPVPRPAFSRRQATVHIQQHKAKPGGPT